MILKIKQLQAPSDEPVTISAAKAHLRVDINDDDALIGGLISAARRYAEKFTGRSFITQKWELYLDYDPQNSWIGALLRDRRPDAFNITLPYPNIQSLEAFEYQSEIGVWTPLDSDAYSLDAPGQQVVLLKNPPTPAIYESAFRIQYTAGYGAAKDVPEDIKLAIKTICNHWYENRSAYAVSGMQQIPAAGDALLFPHKIMSY